MDLYVITGQTAAGKTKYAYELAKKLNGELINFDSRQIYKKLDIITGKERFKDVKTHLIDFVDPKQYFSSFDFCTKACKALKQIFKLGKTPIFVGGTYMYIKHLLYGVETENIPPNWKLRKKLEKLSIKELQDSIESLNAQLINQLNASDRKNPRRLIRRIEIEMFKNSKITKIGGSCQRIHSRQCSLLKRSSLRAVGSPFFFATRQFCIGNNLNIKIIGLRFKNKECLKNAIKKRIEQKIKDGAFQEVKSLMDKGYNIKDPGLQTIGYKQIIQYFSGKLTKEQTIEQWVNKEVQYAKRQDTFMKKDKKIRWKEI